MKSFYTGPSIESAGKALDDFEASEGWRNYRTAAGKRLWLATCTVEDIELESGSRARAEGEAKREGWKQVLQQLALTYPGRVGRYLT